MPVALFGITNSGLSLFVNLLILFLVVVWLALIAWTYLDARRRIGDPVLVACATGASLFPYVGTIVYTILRPPEFLDDARERELEIRAAELRVRQLEEGSCPNCEFPIERTYLRCPNCRVRVKDPCESCGKPIDPRWTLCPYCETPVRRAEPRRASQPAPRRAERAAPSPRPRPAPERAERTASDRAERGGDRAGRSGRPARSSSDRAAAASARSSRVSGSRSASKDREQKRSPRSARSGAGGGRASERPAPAPES
jgi:Double zinc ribbon